MISILCFTIVLASGLYSVAADDDVAVAGDLPVTGFFSGRVKSGSSVGFKSFRRVQGMAFCNTLEFQNLPDPNYAPFAGGSTFKLITGKLYNEKLAWSNGLEYLSYVLTGNGANWIVGNDPGIDNGYLFINADGKLVPVQQETASNHWFWLMQGTWQQQPPLRLVCIDEKSDSPPYYYIVEYYDEATRAMAQSYLLPFIADLADSGIGAVGTEGIIDPHGSRFSGPVYLNRTTSEWDSVTDLQSVAEMGKPYMVTDSAGKSSLGVLVNEEQSSTGGYMLTFKKYSFQQIEIKKKRINFADWKPNEQTIPDDEVVVEIDSRGKPTPDFVVDGLSSSVKKNYLNSVRTTLDGIEEGDYLWLWYHSLDCMDDDCNNSFISSSGGIKHFFDAEKNSMVDQLLLKCISRTPSKATFLAFPSDRRDTMHRTSLSLNSDLLEMTFQHDGKKNGKFLNPLISFMGLTNLHVSSIFYIGKDVVDYIRKYLYSKENRHPTLSSCYFYHAAVSLPQPLIYAAEIVCVLIGAKPVTMVCSLSFSTDTNKFITSFTCLDSIYYAQ